MALRVGILVLVLVGVGIGIFRILGDSETAAAPTTTSTITSTTTTLALALEAPTIATTEEAEAALAETWFNWFAGIHDEDVETVRRSVATSEHLESARQQFGTLQFERRPAIDDLAFTDTELLLASGDCLAVWTTLAMSGSRTGESTNVHVLRWVDGHWGVMGLWASKTDFWESDCEARL